MENVAIGIATSGAKDLFEFGLAITVLLTMLGLSLSLNIFLIKALLQTKDVLADLKEAISLLNQRIGH